MSSSRYAHVPAFSRVLFALPVFFFFRPKTVLSFLFFPRTDSPHNIAEVSQKPPSPIFFPLNLKLLVHVPIFCAGRGNFFVVATERSFLLFFFILEPLPPFFVRECTRSLFPLGEEVRWSRPDRLPFPAFNRRDFLFAFGSSGSRGAVALGFPRQEEIRGVIFCESPLSLMDFFFVVFFLFRFRCHSFHVRFSFFALEFPPPSKEIRLFSLQTLTARFFFFL